MWAGVPQARAFMWGGPREGQRSRWSSGKQEDTMELAGGEAVVPQEELLPGIESKLRH